jgi:hypothetical protein
LNSLDHSLRTSLPATSAAGPSSFSAGSFADSSRATTGRLPAPEGASSRVSARVAAAHSRRTTRTAKVALLLALLVGLPLLVHALGGSHPLLAAEIEQALREQMNSSAAGRLTQSVDCTRLVRSAEHGPARYACTLMGADGARVLAVVEVADRSWRAEWAPLRG